MIIDGTDGRDTLVGTSDNDEISGARGRDLLVGGEGDDRFFAGIGDCIVGGPGADSVGLSFQAGDHGTFSWPDYNPDEGDEFFFETTFSDRAHLIDYGNTIVVVDPEQHVSATIHLGDGWV